MPTHGPDLSKLSLSQLAELTGHDRRTIRTRLRDLEPAARDGRTLWYPSRAALERIFLGESVDLTTERAKLAREQAAAQRFRNERERGLWVTAAERDRVTIGLAIATRDKILAVPNAIAPRLAAEATTRECGRICYDALHLALSAMADEADAAVVRLQAEEEKGRQADAPTGRGRTKGARA